jgi:hypothetical protein
VVLYSYSLVDFYLYVFGTIILYGIMKNYVKMAFEIAIICLCDQFGIFLVNTRTEPNLPKPNFLGTDFSKKPIGTCFRGIEFTEEPKYRTDQFGNTECPGLAVYRLGRVSARRQRCCPSRRRLCSLQALVAAADQVLTLPPLRAPRSWCGGFGLQATRCRRCGYGRDSALRGRRQCSLEAQCRRCGYGSDSSRRGGSSS